MSFSCSGCSTACCKAFRIYLLPGDLFRLSGFMQVPPEAICLPVQLGPENSDYRAWSFSLGEEERFLLGLRRPRGRCIFHLDLGGTGRCGAYSLRPLVCRMYPFEVSARRAPSRSGGSIRASAALVSGRRVTLVRQALCSEVGPLTPGEVEEVRRLEKTRAREGLLFEALLESWHEEGLPAMNAEGLPTRAFRARFRRFLAYLSARTPVPDEVPSVSVDGR